MKCILCPKYGDVRRLLDYPTVCTCCASWGQNKDANRAEYGGRSCPHFHRQQFVGERCSPVAGPGRTHIRNTIHSRDCR